MTEYLQLFKTPDGLPSIGRRGRPRIYLNAEERARVWAERRRQAYVPRRRPSLVTRLPQGWIVQDPETGKWYERDGKTKVRTAQPWPCAANCGKTIHRSRRYVRKHGQPYCKDCRPARGGQPLPVGSRRPGGDGYVAVKTGMPSQWQLEHRVVMATHLGRPLLETETVHHIDGNRGNNTITNLQLRRGQHGAGVVHECLDCGSMNVVAVPIG